MPAFLTCYDYGQGGIWLYVDAQSASEIANSYPALQVFETPPPFWTDELEHIVRNNSPTTSPHWAEWLSKLKRF